MKKVMNRTDFMNQLESLLQNISPAEREEALQYYNEYFNDAGAENEQDVIDALGNPAKVAENIKRDIYGGGYGDMGYQRATVNDRAMVEYQQRNQNTASAEKKDEKMPTWALVLIIVLCLFASPVILGVGSGLIGAIAGIVVAWFSMIFAFGAAALALIGSFVFLLVVGVMSLFVDPLVGVAMIGAGMVCGGLGALFLMLTVAMAGIATPAICRGVVKLFRQITNKN